MAGCDCFLISMVYREDKMAWRSGGRLGSLKGFSRPIVLNIFFFSLEGNCLGASKYVLQYFVSGFVWVCGHVYPPDRRHKKEEEKVSGEVVLCTCISVYLRVDLLNPRGKSLFLIGPRIFFCNQGALEPKWTTGDCLWWMRLNANHSKHSNSHTSIMLSEAAWANKAAKIGHWLHLRKDQNQSAKESIAQLCRGNWSSKPMVMFHLQEKRLSPLLPPTATCHTPGLHICLQQAFSPKSSFFKLFISQNVRGHDAKTTLIQATRMGVAKCHWHHKQLLKHMLWTWWLWTWWG